MDSKGGKFVGCIAPGLLVGGFALAVLGGCLSAWSDSAALKQKTDLAKNLKTIAGVSWTTATIVVLIGAVLYTTYNIHGCWEGMKK